MNQKEVSRLGLNLYELHWKEGGYSLASVGQDANGKKWYAPVNWVNVPGYDWKKVKSVKKIR